MLSRTIPPTQFQLGDGKEVTCSELVFLDLTFLTQGTNIKLSQVPTYILPGDDNNLLLIGQTELSTLGYQRPEDWLQERSKNAPVELQAAAPVLQDDTLLSASPGIQKATRIQMCQSKMSSFATEDQLSEANSDSDDIPEEGVRASVHDPDQPTGAMEGALADMLRRAESNGASTETMRRLTAIVSQYKDVFRLELGNDPPARVEPMVIEMIEDDALTCSPRARRFAPLQMDFIADHVQLLLELGVAKPSNSDFASPIVLARKKDGNWRLCVDLRFVNSKTKPLRWPLPKIHELLPHLAGAAVFASFDLLRGFWQFPLAEESAKYWAFITHHGLYEFTRVVMGGKNSAPHFQKVMSQMLQALLFTCVLVYLDDVLAYAQTEADLCTAIEKVLAIFAEFGIKLKPSKCELFCRLLVWCGHQISAAGIGVNPDFISAVERIPLPSNAAELRQFVAACNWVRGKIPLFANLVEPLQQILTTALATRKSKKTQSVSKVLLSFCGWGEKHTVAFEALKKAIAHSVRLAHLDDNKVVCLFPDASDNFWGCILTQVPETDATSNKPVEDWAHEPLGFLSGCFRGASARWGIPDKEAYAIRISCEKFTHLLIRRKGFSIFTDHRNLIYIFNPSAVISAVSKPTADRLERWAVYLRGFTYDVHHIPGDVNVWADMISRWGSVPVPKVARRTRMTSPTTGAEVTTEGTQERQAMLAAAALRVRADRILLDQGFTGKRTDTSNGNDWADPEEQWPSIMEIIEAQQHITTEEVIKWGLTMNEEGVLLGQTKVIFIPDRYKLRQRLLVIAHAGLAGHRGQDITVKRLTAQVWWPGIKEEILGFVRGCLLCLKTKGGKVEPPPLGQALQGNSAGEAIHLDFVSTSPGRGNLVIKCGFTLYIMLFLTKEFTAEVAEACVIQWAALFGVPAIIVSDGGSHFNNMLVKALTRRFRARHHITTAYAAWANGAIERVMRELIRLYRTLMAELSLDEQEEHLLAPLVQAAMNQTPSTARGGLTPAALMLGRETAHPLDTLAYNGLDEEQRQLAEAVPIHDRAGEYFKSTAEALQASWLKAASAMNRRHEQNVLERERAAGRAARKNRASGKANTPKTPNYAVGDFVLVQCPIPRNKLKLKWLGPYRVVDTVSAWVYILEDIVSSKRSTVHVQRMRFYSDAAFDVTEDVKNQAQYDGVLNFTLEKFVDWRETDTGTLEIRVRWLGFESNEDTWEPLVKLHEDVPEVLRRYLIQVRNECPLADEFLSQDRSTPAQNIRKKAPEKRSRGRQRKQRK